MLDIKRLKELKAMSREQLMKIAEKLRCRPEILDIMAAEFERDNPDLAKNIKDWLK